MLFYINHFVEVWLLPPGCNLILACIGFLLWRSRPKLAKGLVIFSFLALWLFSTPITTRYLLNNLQYRYPTLSPSELRAEKDAAIVVLEASLNMNTPEYGQPTVTENTLARIRYAAFLHKKTGIPILVSGNDPGHPTINQADYMAEALQNYFNVPTKWKEDKGYNTAQEGIYSAQILKAAGVKKIYLVTHASHMPRAMYAFQNKGLEVVAAPTGYKGFGRSLGQLSTYLPSMEALDVSQGAMREYIGMAWYRLYYGG